MKRMKRYGWPLAFSAGLVVCVAAVVYAAAGTFVNPTNSTEIFGYHVSGTETTNPRGYILDFNDTTAAQRKWAVATDRPNGDLLFFSYAANAYQMAMRGDTGQIAFGPAATHPTGSYQILLTAGTSAVPRPGMAVGVWGNQDGLYLFQSQTAPATKRAKINFNATFQMGTDSGNNNTPDFWMFNNATGRFPMRISDASNSDIVFMDNGATVATTLKSTGTLQHTGTSLGFYNATPVTKPVITGCRSDGTALANLLTALKNQGLITDNTTP